MLNLRIVFTYHIINKGTYYYSHSELDKIVKFELKANTLRYIIVDSESIRIIIQLLSGKFRTVKT